MTEFSFDMSSGSDFTAFVERLNEQLINASCIPYIHPVEGIGNIRCKFNARSPCLRCSVNPCGPCDVCKDFEPITTECDRK